VATRATVRPGVIELGRGEDSLGKPRVALKRPLETLDLQQVYPHSVH
jgi:hypothetical protein